MSNVKGKLKINPHRKSKDVEVKSVSKLISNKN